MSASAPDPAKSTGSWAAACTASLWNMIPRACAASARAAIGWTAPTSLLAHITLTRATLAGSASMAAVSASGARIPSLPTSTY